MYALSLAPDVLDRLNVTLVSSSSVTATVADFSPNSIHSVPRLFDVMVWSALVSADLPEDDGPIMTVSFPKVMSTSCSDWKCLIATFLILFVILRVFRFASIFSLSGLLIVLLSCTLWLLVFVTVYSPLSIRCVCLSVCGIRLVLGW